MEVKDAIKARRAYRSLAAIDVTDELIGELANAAQLTASCFNKQPWRFVFVYDKKALESIHPALSRGNDWVKKASLIIVVAAKKDDDCIINEREYYLFDTGMAVNQMILRATELGLVAHPIAGYEPEKVRKALGIPDGYNVITLINIGRHSDVIPDYLSEQQVEAEKERPERLAVDEFAFMNNFGRK